MDETPIVSIDNQRIVDCVFDRVLADKEVLEQEIAEAARKFISKYRDFKIESVTFFDIYCGGLKCAANLQLK